jgi:hypothetical protein
VAVAAAEELAETRLAQVDEVETEELGGSML